MEMDYYAILGVNKNASIEEIKNAYHKLAFQYHPDKNKGPDAVNRFIEIAKAYGVLSGKEKNDNYDKCGTPKSDGTLKRFSGTTNRSSSFFSLFGARKRHREQNTPMDRHMEQNLPMKYADPSVSRFSSFFSFFNLFRARNHHRKQNTPIDCLQPATQVQLQRQMVQDPPVEHDLYVTLEEIDKGCNKKMKISRMVAAANGDEVLNEKYFNVIVKPGCEDGTKISFESEGDQTSDIIFIIRDKPHSVFKREGNDIKYTAHISWSQAFFGSIIQVPTLHSGHITFSTQDETINSNTVKRLPGKGLPFPDDPTKRGDLLVAFDIKINS